MYNMSIGVMLESFLKPDAEAMAIAHSIGAQGLQVYATPARAEKHNIVTDAGKKEFLKLVKDNGLVISALCGDMGHGFTHPELNDDLIEKSKRILDTALELETNIVTTHIGVVPEDDTCDTYKILQDACGQLAAYADKMNAHFAIETGPEPSARLKKFLDSLHSTGVAVNLDPANLVMCVGDDPVQAVYNLKDYIVHTHAKDGIMLTETKAEDIYGNRAGQEVVVNVGYKELPLGQGGVPFPAYIKALDSIGYKGFLTIERECGDNPTADIEMAVGFLQNLIK